MNEPLYEDRESIHPKAFAIRHLVIQEVKFRKAGADAATSARLDRIARGIEVEYDTLAHAFVVRCEGTTVRHIGLETLTLYARGDTAVAHQRRDDHDVRHWDMALEENRRYIAALVDDLVARLRAQETTTA